jgi:type 1 fimbriae regulatory protein FimB/type 1 fimbriae regulatory protein FimE
LRHRVACRTCSGPRHGLRASEIADLEWSQVELGRAATLHVRRAQNGNPSAHPLRGDEVRALRELRRQSPESAFAFATERGGPFTPDAINRLVKRIAERVGLTFPVHAQMLRHGCGYALAAAGHMGDLLLGVKSSARARGTSLRSQHCQPGRL